MRNRLPSLLTAARFPLALGLLAAEVSTRFLALYLLCCLTDVLDGLAARRLNACSAFGARLDSAADLAVTAVLVWRLWPRAAPDPWLTLWICVAAAVRLAAALAARLRFGRFGFLHTWGNKCTGVLLALYPFALVLTGSRWTLVIVLIAASLSSLEAGRNSGRRTGAVCGKKDKEWFLHGSTGGLGMGAAAVTLPDDPWARYPRYAVLRSPAVNGMA